MQGKVRVCRVRCGYVRIMLDVEEGETSAVMYATITASRSGSTWVSPPSRVWLGLRLGQSTAAGAHG